MSEHEGHGPPGSRRGGHVSFTGLDELGGAPYRVLASFRATILYPYDVALAIFYELYSMGMPMFLPSIENLASYTFRGLHQNSEYHHVQPGLTKENSMAAGAG